MNKTTIAESIPNKQMNIERAFKAPLKLVGNAWTESTLLDQWWAPKAWKAVTKYMDFREGVYWLYSRNGPASVQYWARAGFEQIELHKSFVDADSFCDEHGNKNFDYSLFFYPAVLSKMPQPGIN